MKVGDRVRWDVYLPSHTRSKPALTTFYGVVTRLRRDPFMGCPNCGYGGEEGAMVRPDDREYESWHSLRSLEMAP